MASYLFNGIPLPKLPDLSGHDYTVIIKTPLMYVLLAYDTDGYVATNSVYVQQYISNSQNDALYFTVDAVFGGTEWEQGANADSQHAQELGLPMWSNFDIPNRDTGTLYLAASDPIPVGKPITDPLSHMVGYQIGCRLRAQRAVKKIVGYSYNGTVLPVLPNTDLPYAVIVRHPLTGSTWAYFIQNIKHAQHPETGSWCVLLPNGTLKTALNSELQKWGDFEDLTSDGVVVTAITWANFDVLNKDGTIHLSASEPIPVYE